MTDAFVWRAIRFMDSRILEWMKKHTLKIYEPIPQGRKDGFLFNCEVLPHRLVAPPPGLPDADFTHWALSHWGFKEASASCTDMWLYGEEYILVFSTIGRFKARWFELLSLAMQQEIPDVFFMVESHLDGKPYAGNLCIYEKERKTILKEWNNKKQFGHWLAHHGMDRSKDLYGPTCRTPVWNSLKEYYPQLWKDAAPQVAAPMDAPVLPLESETPETELPLREDEE